MSCKELHEAFYGVKVSLITEWAARLTYHFNIDRDITGEIIYIAIVLDKNNNSDETIPSVYDLGYTKYILFENEIEAITKSFQKFLNLKAFL